MNRFTRWLAAAVLACALSASAAQQSHFLKDIVIEPGQVVEGDLTVYRGDLTVEGEITGNVAVMFGNCRILPGARIGGDLAVLQGTLELSDPDEQVGGRISQRDFLKGALSDEDSPFEGPGTDVEIDETMNEGRDDRLQEWEGDDDTDLFLSFNRVAGLQLGLKFSPERARIRKGKWADVAGHAAWAFGQSRPEWDLKLRRRLLDESGLYIAVGAHRKTDTQDAWMLSTMENSLAGWLLHMDFFDWYDSKGGMAELGGFFFDGRLQLEAGWFQEKYGSLDRETQWSWSGADRDYRENLFSDSLFVSNTNRGIRIGADLQLNRVVSNVRRGLALTLNYEKGLDGDPIEYDYQRWLGNLRFWLPLGRKQFESINGRVLAGRTTGDAYPLQYLFRLGGPDALPGYRPKAVDGRVDFRSEEMLQQRLFDNALEPVGKPNMLLLSLENRIRGEVLDFWPLDEVDLLILANAGSVFDADWGDLETGDFEADFGFGIAGADDDWQLAVLRATDTGAADWRLLFRLRPRF